MPQSSVNRPSPSLSRRRSTGGLISTVTFFVFAFFLMLAAMIEENPLKSYALGGCALLSLAGAGRHGLQSWAEKRRARRAGPR